MEAGTCSADWLSIVERICEVLRIDLPVLIGRELPRDTEQCLDTDLLHRARGTTPPLLSDLASRAGVPA